MESVLPPSSLSSVPSQAEAPVLVSEAEAMRLALKHVREVSHLLVKPTSLVWSAMTFFHRFFADTPMGTFPPNLFASTCLFIAAKLSDEPLSLRDVINAYYVVAYPNRPLLQVGSMMQTLEDAVVIQEQYLVRKLRFDLSVHRPHDFLVNYAKTFAFPAATVKLAWAVLNDSLASSVCIRFVAHVLAVSALLVADKLSPGVSHSVILPAGMSQLYLKWYNVCDVSERQSKDCCEALEAIYSDLSSSSNK